VPLLRRLARTAAIAGTATAVSNRVSRRQAGRWAQQDQPPAEDPGPAAEEEAVQDPAASTSDRLAQLKQLGELKDAGVLTDAEFAEQKAKILDS
jgi:hypothetical protein